MNWLRKIFGFNKQKETPKEEHKSNASKFAIEFYPITKRYYPVFDGMYIRKRPSTGIYELQEEYLFPFADYGRTEQEAWDMIEEYKEQRLKKNVITIRK